MEVRLIINMLNLPFAQLTDLLLIQETKSFLRLFHLLAQRNLTRDFVELKNRSDRLRRLSFINRAHCCSTQYHRSVKTFVFSHSLNLLQRTHDTGLISLPILGLHQLCCHVDQNQPLHLLN